MNANGAQLVIPEQPDHQCGDDLDFFLQLLVLKVTGDERKTREIEYKEKEVDR